MFLNIIKAICDKPRANIMLNGEQMKPFLLKSEMTQGCLLSPLLFDIVLEFLARAIRQEQEKKGFKYRRKNKELSLLTVHMILYLKDHEN
jgi:hypothetical protein